VGHSNGIVRTSAAAAKALGISTRSLRNWLAAGAPRPGPGGFWDVSAILQWRQKHILPRRGGPPPGGEARVAASPSPTALTHAERLLKAQADEREARAALAKLRLHVEQGKYLSREEVEERGIARIMAVKRGLLAFPKALAPLVVGMSVPEAEALILSKVRELLIKFSTM
jgi:hypothetical protein